MAVVTKYLVYEARPFITDNSLTVMNGVFNSLEDAETWANAFINQQQQPDIFYNAVSVLVWEDE